MTMGIETFEVIVGGKIVKKGWTHEAENYSDRLKAIEYQTGWSETELIERKATINTYKRGKRTNTFIFV